MKLFKKRKIQYFSFYGGYVLFIILNGILYGQYNFIDTTYEYIFPLLLVTIFVSFASFLSTIFSSEKYEDFEYKYLLIMHAGYFVFAMILYRIIFWY